MKRSTNQIIRLHFATWHRNVDGKMLRFLVLLSRQYLNASCRGLHSERNACWVTLRDCCCNSCICSCRSLTLSSFRSCFFAAFNACISWTFSAICHWVKAEIFPGRVPFTEKIDFYTVQLLSVQPFSSNISITLFQWDFVTVFHQMHPHEIVYCLQRTTPRQHSSLE